MTPALRPTQREFFKLAIPNILAAMAVPVTELVDIGYLGHLESVTPLSGVVLATVVFSYIYWCFGFLRIGTTGLTAQAAGREDQDEQEALLWRGVLMGAVIGLLLTLFQHPIGNLSFSILSGSGEVEAAGRDYYNAHIWGAFPVMIGFALVGWLLGIGRTGYVFISYTIWQVSNIILNYFFIVKFGWGSWGAGLGSALAEWISSILTVGLVWKCLGRFPKFDVERIFHWSELKRLLTLNSAIMGRTFLLMSVLAAFTNISATFGVVALAANALMMQLFVFFAYVTDGYAIALEILAGKSLGRNSKTELRRSFNLAMRWTLISGAVFALVYAFGTGFILSLLTEHQEVVDAATPYAYWMCATILIGGVAFVYDGFFYGLAKPKLLFNSMFFSSLSFVPLAYYAWQQQSTTWLWIAFLTFTIIRTLALINPVRKALQ
ncbi:MAG: MATE family efflux transporter [Rickettsiales bacterium]|nr:MATE family efflux transporter [Rickettsiales bacterium]